MSLTLTDMFCGAGGSSTGAIMVPGVSVRVASNHWDLAIETHNTNHPDTDHICADISQIDPRYFPRTDIGWFSPSCTKHSIAQGKRQQDKQPDLFGETLPDEAAERSRATMWDVVRFAEYHAYEAVIVENVVEVTAWPPFHSWLLAMRSIGYDHEVIMLNSMHAQAHGPGAPQSRDRFYCVFWLRGNRRPDLAGITRPAAVCPDCGPVRAVQSWKNPDRPRIGKYRQQYVYRCPNIACRNRIVEPAARPASDIIDWTLLGTRIGDRDRPLAAKTMARITAGIEKYWIHTPALAVPVEGRDGKQAAPVDGPLRTMTTRSETGLALIAELRGGGSTARPASDPLATVTASGNHHGLVTTYYRNGGIRSTDEALATVTTVERHGLITPAGGTWRDRATPTTEPIPARTTRESDGIATPGVDLADVRFRMLEPREIAAAMDFPDGYVILGNRREQVRQSGNAVTPPAARDLVAAVAESLGGAE